MNFKMWQVKVEVENRIKTIFINGNTVTQARSNFYQSDVYIKELMHKDFRIKEIIDPDCVCK